MTAEFCSRDQVAADFGAVQHQRVAAFVAQRRPGEVKVAGNLRADQADRALGFEVEVQACPDAQIIGDQGKAGRVVGAVEELAVGALQPPANARARYPHAAERLERLVHQHIAADLGALQEDGVFAAVDRPGKARAPHQHVAADMEPAQARREHLHLAAIGGGGSEVEFAVDACLDANQLEQPAALEREARQPRVADVDRIGDIARLQAQRWQAFA